ncbi:MAG TPA: FtsX-like permease family protein, partial [Blastocatellia bacterium]|nr:FtsX-like permease family protein [Blastocatellia bacterium]
PLTLERAYADAFMHGITPKPDEPGITPKPPIPGVAVATPAGEWFQSGSGAFGFELVDGIEWTSFVDSTGIRITEGRPFARGDGGRLEALVDRYYTEHNIDLSGRQVQVGSKITVLGHEFTVVGIYEPAMLARVKIQLKTMQELLGGGDNCSFILIKVDRPEHVEAAMAALREHYADLRVISTEDLPAIYSQGMAAIDIFLNSVTGLAAVISALVILLAMYTTIIERTREIGILKSLGASKAFIIVTIEKEAALISALGVALGFAISVIAKFWIESNTRLKIDLGIRWFLISAGIGLVAGLLGAIYPAVRAAKLDPIEALSYE